MRRPFWSKASQARDGRPRPRTRLIAVAALMAAAGLTAITSAGAGAAACDTPVPAGSGCAATGTLTTTGGDLALTSPASLSWSATVTGTDQNLVDVTAADQQYTVDDATGSGAGWHITVSATTFTNGTHKLPDTGTFVTNGSVASVSATTAPTAACAASTTCTLPTDLTTYPVAITTAPASPTAMTIYDADTATGMGQIVIGGSASANPVGWWLNAPADVYVGAYTSTVTIAIVSTP